MLDNSLPSNCAIYTQYTKHTIFSETTRKTNNHWLDEGKVGSFSVPFHFHQPQHGQLCKEEVLSTYSTANIFSQNEEAGMSLWGLQCNSWQVLCQNLESCHSESLEESLFTFSPNYILLRKMHFRQQIGLLSEKSSNSVFSPPEVWKVEWQIFRLPWSCFLL